MDGFEILLNSIIHEPDLWILNSDGSLYSEDKELVIRKYHGILRFEIRKVFNGGDGIRGSETTVFVPNIIQAFRLNGIIKNWKKWYFKEMCKLSSTRRSKD